MPEEATVEDVEQLHIEAWRLGLKAVAHLPRQLQGRASRCRRRRRPATEPMRRTRSTPSRSSGSSSTVIVQEPVRQKLPRTRNSKTFSFRVADCHGYVTVGEYEDGRPGEVFLKVAKQGSTLAGIMDAFAISVSHGLQYGVPLEAFVEKFTNMRFEPAGMTDDPDIRIATSLVDYIFRRLAVEYLPLREARGAWASSRWGSACSRRCPGVEEATTPTSRRRRAPARGPGAVGVDASTPAPSRRAPPAHARAASVGDGALPRLRRHHAARRHVPRLPELRQPPAAARSR